VRRAQREGLAATVFRPALVTASAAGRFVRRDITARVLGYMIRNSLMADEPNQVSFLPVDVCARNIVALSRQPDGLAPVLHMTADDYRTLGDICDVITSRYGYAFARVSLGDFVAHAHAHCRPDDDLYPLLSFLDRNTKRILRMGDKRYDSSAYRSARDGNALAAQHPALEEIVDPIVVFLQREGLVPVPPSVRKSGIRDGGAAAGARA
jgi:thioester reductase-like protein